MHCKIQQQLQEIVRNIGGDEEQMIHVLQHLLDITCLLMGALTDDAVQYVIKGIQEQVAENRARFTEIAKREEQKQEQYSPANLYEAERAMQEILQRLRKAQS